MISAYQARLALAEKNLDSAGYWSESYDHQLSAENLRDFEELTLARILLSQGDYSEALSGVKHILEKAVSAGRIASVIEAKNLEAQALEALGNRQAGIEATIQAVELAHPEGFVRVFLNEGKNIVGLLSRVRQLKIPANVMSYTWRLLEAFEDISSVHTSSFSTPNSLVEPLSERELEVLQLIAEGLSNPEIAARLYLSVNTLRAHTTNIYQKLDVHSRMQAVTRARELGLLKSV
jgi:LuxR family maltose regulon positive regulatory protein